MSEATDWIGAAGVVFGIGSALYAHVIGGRADAAKAKAEEALGKAEAAQTKAQIGWLELQLRVFLSSRRDQIHSIARDLEELRAGRDANELTENEKKRFALVFKRFMSAHEDFLGALEQACRHFRDDKIDKEAFRLMYNDEVRRVTVDATKGEPFHELMYPRDQCRFEAIWHVKDEWFNLDKKKGKT